MTRLDMLLQSSAKQSPYFGKDSEKARRATQFIGQGSPASSTNAYARALAEYSNTGRYSADDVVFVSAEGMRSGRFDPIAPDGPHGAYVLIDAAIAARARFVIDGPADRHRRYNLGERQVAAYLAARGYAEIEAGLFVPANRDEGA